MNHNVLYGIRVSLEDQDIKIRQEAVWVLSNITAVKNEEMLE